MNAAPINAIAANVIATNMTSAPVLSPRNQTIQWTTSGVRIV
jgi:hypothetical protein